MTENAHRATDEQASCDDWTKIAMHCKQCGAQFFRKVKFQRYCDEHRHLDGAVIRPTEMESADLRLADTCYETGNLCVYCGEQPSMHYQHADGRLNCVLNKVALNQGPRQADGVGSNPHLSAQDRPYSLSSNTVYEFDRYVRGQLKAEAIRITRAESLEQALLKAVGLANPHDVLVLRGAPEWGGVEKLAQQRNDALAEVERLRAALELWQRQCTGRHGSQQPCAESSQVETATARSRIPAENPQLQAHIRAVAAFMEELGPYLGLEDGLVTTGEFIAAAKRIRDWCHEHQLPLDFVKALKIAEGVFEQYRKDQPKWWRKMDGTPILNDVAVRMAEAFRDEAKSPLKAKEHYPGVAEAIELQRLSQKTSCFCGQPEKSGVHSTDGPCRTAPDNCEHGIHRAFCRAVHEVPKNEP